MTKERPTTIAAYIRAAPSAGQQHLRQLYALLKSVAPDADEAIKWGTPFFVEPRFLFAFSAHKAHCSFAPVEGTLEHYRDDLRPYQTTGHTLRLPYDEPLPEALIRTLAEHSVHVVRERTTDTFW